MGFLDDIGDYTIFSGFKGYRDALSGKGAIGDFLGGGSSAASAKSSESLQKLIDLLTEQFVTGTAEAKAANIAQRNTLNAGFDESLSKSLGMLSNTDRFGKRAIQEQADQSVSGIRARTGELGLGGTTVPDSLIRGVNVDAHDAVGRLIERTNLTKQGVYAQNRLNKLISIGSDVNRYPDPSGLVNLTLAANQAQASQGGGGLGGILSTLAPLIQMGLPILGTAFGGPLGGAAGGLAAGALSQRAAGAAPQSQGTGYSAGYSQSAYQPKPAIGGYEGEYY